MTVIETNAGASTSSNVDKPAETAEEKEQFLAQSFRRLTSNLSEAHNVKETESPVTKLIKNLQSLNVSKRALTCATFSEHSPILVVGDSTGVVTLYRILRPCVVTNEASIEGFERMKQAVVHQADPATAAKLTSLEKSSA